MSFPITSVSIGLITIIIGVTLKFVLSHLLKKPPTALVSKRGFRKSGPPFELHNFSTIREPLIDDARVKRKTQEMTREILDELMKAHAEISRIRVDVLKELEKGERRELLIDFVVNGFFFVMGIVVGFFV